MQSKFYYFASTFVRSMPYYKIFTVNRFNFEESSHNISHDKAGGDIITLNLKFLPFNISCGTKSDCTWIMMF